MGINCHWLYKCLNIPFDDFTTINPVLVLSGGVAVTSDVYCPLIP